MRKIYTLILLFSYITLHGQIKLHEIGIFVGKSYYMGELNRTKLFYQPGNAVSLLYKINFNSRYTLRVNAIYANLKGDDAASEDRYKRNRDHKFDIGITEFSSMLEFNFLEYKPLSKYDYYSFYMTLGAGVLLMPADENQLPVSLVIPFGIGFKYAATKRIGLALEWTYRKTFTDYIDQLSVQKYTETPDITNKQITNNQNKDWYSFAGITLTYKFALGNSKCAAY